MDLKKLFFEKNVGSLDRLVRIVLGLLFLGLAYFTKADLSVRGVFAIIGLVGVVTGIMSHCSVYSIFGWNTLEKG